MTNQRTRTTHSSYPTTSYNHNINPNITNRTSFERLGTPLTHKANLSKTSHTVDKDKCKSSNANTPPKVHIQTIIDHVYDIYEPLRLALQAHGSLKAGVKIIPTVIS
jgi:hypothetical protein